MPSGITGLKTPNIMFKIKQNVERAVQIATDPELRARSIAQLEKKLELNRISLLCSLLAFVALTLIYMMDRDDPHSLKLLLFIGFVTLCSLLSYASYFNRLVQLKIEEARDCGKDTD